MRTPLQAQTSKASEGMSFHGSIAMLSFVMAS